VDSTAALRILEAGCGRRCHPDTTRDGYIVGIDTDPDGLALNDALDERIVADIQTHPIEVESFDLIVCHDVLEHLPQPMQALDNLAAALRPGGEMRIGLPHVLSRKSLVAKLTPQWFHVFVYRRLGYELAGMPGYGPFRTYLRWSLRPRSLLRWAESRGLEVKDFHLEVGDAFKQRPILRLLVGHATECRFVLKKRV
jgi:SAM-dependent methyltransferase